MRIHLDPVGGMAGDMFIAAVIDALPEHADALLATLRSLRLPPGVSVGFADDCSDAIKGRRFVVSVPDEPVLGADAEQAGSGRHRPHGPTGHHRHGRHDPSAAPAPQHHHRPYKDICAWLDETALPEPIKRHARALFAMLAAAESRVHGIALEAVQFHEVGAWDSIVDFVAAAWVIDALKGYRWSWSPLPLGSGRVHCAHGLLPAPAPATTLLLTGMAVVDDGIAGERVTPTGAAILRYLYELQPEPAPRASHPEVITASGIGHGTKALAGVPNIVRCMVLADHPRSSALVDEEIASIQFEVDDQSPEDLAVAIDHLRQSSGVLEIYQAPLYGKKGRIAVQLQILLEVSAADRVAAICFEETTTLGLRISRLMRRTLDRKAVTIGDVEPVPVKLALRPSGDVTAKAEMDALSGRSGHADRERARAFVQERALIERDS